MWNLIVIFKALFLSRVFFAPTFVIRPFCQGFLKHQLQMFIRHLLYQKAKVGAEGEKWPKIIPCSFEELKILLGIGEVGVGNRRIALVTEEASRLLLSGPGL